MKKRVNLIAAPPTMSPGGYVPKAYVDRNNPATPFVDIQTSSVGSSLTISVAWPCPNPVRSIKGETDKFLDAAAIMVPLTGEAQLMLMGQPEHGVEIAYWRADDDQLRMVQAQGLGSSVRKPAPSDWKAISSWSNGVFGLSVTSSNWAALTRMRKFAIAIWRGEAADRGGLKSISPEWIDLS